MIGNNRENLVKQKIQVTEADASTTTSAITTKTSQAPTFFTFEPKEIENLSQAFGIFGSPKNMHFCCPKCGLQTRDENEMKKHLELELNKIRWRCSSCSDYSQYYHEAQFHCMICKNLRPGQSARPIEAVRDPCMRASWVSAVVHVQKQMIKQPEDSLRSFAKDGQSLSTIENLLDVRYEEKVPTPEEAMLLTNKSTSSTSTALSIAASPDSDDERLVIDEQRYEVESPPRKRLDGKKKCKYCDFVTKYSQVMYGHTLRHYNLMPYKCAYCGFSCHKSSMINHFANFHPGEPEKCTKTLIPTGPPLTLKPVTKRYRTADEVQPAVQSIESIPKKGEAKPKEDVSKSICLVCEKVVSEAEKSSHFHDKIAVTYAKRGDVVVKCRICLALLLDDNAMQEHHTTNHPDTSINYAYFKLNHDTREIHYCGYCNKGFKFHRDLRTHHTTLHSSCDTSYRTADEDQPAVQSIESIPKKEEAKPKAEVSKSICLVCETVVSEAEKRCHFHGKIAVTYAKKGDIVVKCCICLALLLDCNAMQEHHTTNHPDTSINYAYFKLNHDTREIHYCGHCNKGFKFIRDLRTHHTTLHSSLSFKYESKPYTPGSRNLLDNEQEGTSCVKKKNDDDSTLPLKKRIARKSTTKLPNKNVARKSTTKLPCTALEDSDTELSSQEFSF